MAFNPKSFKVLSFDIYGTLIDWETGIFEGLLPLLSQLPADHPQHKSNTTPTAQRRFLLSAYTKLEHSIQDVDPTLEYSKVLSQVYSYLATQLSIPAPSQQEAEAFGSTIGAWPAFPDTVAAMQVLGKHYRLVVLSNVDKASFARTCSGPLKGVTFDGIYTAEDIGSYKPDLNNFAYMVEKAKRDFGAAKEEILVVAQSLFHDHVPARKIGLQPSVWIKRAGDEAAMGGKLEELKDGVRLAAVFGTLGEFAAEVDKAFKGT